MIDFKIFARPSPGLFSNIITLELPKSTKLSDFIFELYRTQTGLNSWVYIPSVRILNQIEDDSIYGLLKTGISLSYKVVVKNRETLSVEAEEDCIVERLEMNGHALVAQSNYRRYLIASDSPVFKVYHASLAGDRCVCWDETREESQNPGCEFCGGTGFENGFAYVGRERFALLNSNSAESSINEIIINGAIKTNPMQSWTTGQFVIKPKYILVREDTNRAYEVISSNPSLIKGVLVKQEIVFKEIEEGSPVYVHIERED